LKLFFFYKLKSNQKIILNRLSRGRQLNYVTALLARTQIFTGEEPLDNRWKNATQIEGCGLHSTILINESGTNYLISHQKIKVLIRQEIRSLMFSVLFYEYLRWTYSEWLLVQQIATRSILAVPLQGVMHSFVPSLFYNKANCICKSKQCSIHY